MVFLSKIQELRLVMKPKFVVKDPAYGVQVHPGRAIEFFNGRYETNDPEEINFIKNSTEYGSKITSIEKGDLSEGKGPEVITGSMGAGASDTRRTYKCLRCGMDGFGSGFEIAQHRKSGECDEISLSTCKEDESPDEK